MARDKCRICGQIVPVNEGRSGHLRKVHGINSKYKGAVKDFFEEES